MALPEKFYHISLGEDGNLRVLDTRETGFDSQGADNENDGSQRLLLRT